MPNTCAAYGCNYRFGPDTKKKGITFHLLPPPTDVRRKLWISNSRRIDPVTRKPWDPASKYVYFCSEHFMPSDFENTGKPFGRRLKDNAVPTVFTFPTVAPESPVKQSSDTTSPIDMQNMAMADIASAKGKLFPRTRKSKHRKVVMLPKKIKQLQEDSPSNVESVTIISFQHLGYDEKLQPMFEEAMLDLQYPEDSEVEPEEEYCDDEYTELQDSTPLEEEETELVEKSNQDEQVQDDTQVVDNSEVVTSLEETEEMIVEEVHNHKEPEHASSSTENTDTGPEEMCPNAEHPKESNIDNEPETSTQADQAVQDKSPQVTKTVLLSQPMKTAQGEEKMPVKRRIPVVIKELSIIDDLEELRTKAFRIAEDNIKLKKQVIYLEQKLQEVVSQMNVK